MSNLRSDCRDLVKVLPAGDVYRSHIERLCHQIDEIESYWHKANQRIIAIREAVEAIVCTEGEDKGVVMVDHESPTKYDEERGCHVYLHEHFSPLGGALIAVHSLCETQGIDR